MTRVSNVKSLETRVSRVSNKSLEWHDFNKKSCQSTSCYYVLGPLEKLLAYRLRLRLAKTIFAA
jgi:Uri superfamily endonuclease